jgi:hypothetical protein
MAIQTQKVKGKRGRKAGSVSFCKVTLEELNRCLKPAAQVIISLRFANMVGLGGQKIVADAETVKGLANSKDVDIQIEKFEDREEEGIKPIISLETFN